MGILDPLRELAVRFFESTRQNHALEHATVAVLMRRRERPVRIIGRAAADGFYLHADLPTEEVEGAVHEALDRMRHGADYLAVSPFCGTNIAVAGALAAVACLATLGTKDRAGNLPIAMAAAAGAIVLAQPLGALAQRHITTTANVEDLRVVDVTRRVSLGGAVHKVATARGDGG